MYAPQGSGRHRSRSNQHTGRGEGLHHPACQGRTATRAVKPCAAGLLGNRPTTPLRCNELKSVQSARANREPAAGPEREICLFLGHARSDLESGIGNRANEKLLLVAVESKGIISHRIDPFLCGWGLLMTDWGFASGLPGPLKCFRPRFDAAERQMIVSRKH